MYPAARIPPSKGAFAIDLVKVIQHFHCPAAVDAQATTAAELRSLLTGRQLADSTVAVAVGSRGISCISDVVRTSISVLRTLGARPFIIPAMGSHGGACARGQEELLASYGITEAAVGAPIRSCMDTIELGEDAMGTRVFMDRLAAEADHTLVINRVKPHTDFHGATESGIIKMCVIGLGKHEGAKEIHSYGIDGLRNRIVPAHRLVVSRGNLSGGIAIVENARKEPMLIRALSPGAFETEEPGLLETARGNMPSLPAEDLDVLLVDRMGKDISGTCVDTGVVGRIRIAGQPEPETPSIRTIVADGLTAASHGNALGVGLLDIISRRLYDAIDQEATRQNVLTSSFLERGKIPLVAPTYAEAFRWALRCTPVPAGRDPRIARIRDTLHLEELYISPAALATLPKTPSGRWCEVTDHTLGATEAWR